MVTIEMRIASAYVPARTLQPVRVLTGLVMVVVAACSLEQESPITPPPPTTTPPTTTASSTTPPAGSSTTSLPQDACPEGDVMLADGRLLEFERSNSDGTRIADVTWRTSGDCHVLTISFATDDGAPATTPPTLDVRLLREAGILRIGTDATASVIVDQRVEEGLVEQLFVPVDEEGNRFMDLVLSEPAVARARIATSPARLEIELQPGGPEIGRPLMSPEVILVEPGSEAEATPVLDVAGYSIGDIDHLDIAVLSNDEEVAETSLELEAAPRSWTAFHLAFQIGEDYDTLRVTTDDGTNVAAVPLSR